MTSNKIDRATIKVNGAKAKLSWVEIDGDWGRGYHEIAYKTGGSGWTVIESQLSEDEASAIFYLILQGKVAINDKVCSAHDSQG